jgi:hypothetical protein
LTKYLNGITIYSNETNRRYKTMTRQDLVNKSIDKLNTVKEALELIEILEYDECIAVLTGTKNLPSEIHSALMRRGKEANGGKTTLALAMAGIQNIVNE